MEPESLFARPVAELVGRRYSCRSFDGRGLEAETLAGLERFAAGLALPFGSHLRFGIIDNLRVRAQNLFSAGSYGMIKGARFYLVALVRREDPRRWEDAGFALEAAVLQATCLDVASCWIGGVFDRKRFGWALGIRPGEQLPAVVALGRPALRPSLRDRLVRWSARGDRRRDAGTLFFAGDWRLPLRLEASAPWGRVLECVRLGPSASNKQPWRLIRLGGAFHFYLDRDRTYSAMMPLADLQRIDMGIAMCHFQYSAAEMGLQGEWAVVEPSIPQTPSHFEYIASFMTE
ncbi:MAG: nitroreductase family protein [Candidatus Aminicenantes bacterium]|nr:nitroreductase family protein [Candidatus Aminicenantes bacterium]